MSNRVVKEIDFSSLARLLQPGQLLTNRTELLTYEIDAAIDRGRPSGVVFPRSMEDVGKIVHWTAQRQIPLVARGAGTGLSGGAVAEHGGLIVEFSRMNRILEFEPAGRSAVVEPGLVNQKLDETVKKVGLYYPPDPASGRSATIGGNIAENAGGPHCFKYGVTTNYLTGMEVVLSDGSLVHLGGRAMDYPEYDFTGLLTGSEGTLGIITQASVRLLRNPPAVKTMMAAFNTVEEAGEAVSAIIARGLVPATMEFMDQKMMGIIEAYAHAGLPLSAGAALIIEVDGYAESLSLQIDEIASILCDYNAWDLHVARTAEERDKIWYGRKSAAGAMARLSPSYYLLDGTVPRSKLAQTLTTVNRICDRLELRVGYVFHAGDGNLHPFILIEDPKDPGLLERVFQAGHEIMKICVDQDGSITGEHGVGIEKRKYMPMMYSQAELAVMQDVKEVFDPLNLLNPGKIFPETRVYPSEHSDTTPEVREYTSPYAPTTADEASDLIRSWIASGHEIRIRGGGTKSGLLPATSRTLATQAMCGIHRCAIEDLFVTVGAGTPLTELQSELAEDHMWVPMISPWPESTVGGIIAANFNAPLRMRYGSLRDLVLAATVVLPDGRVIRVGRPVVKNVAGYDLPKLFVGSHGTLGLITEATLKLAPLPRKRLSLIAPVEDLSHGLEWGMRLLPVCLVSSSLLLCRGLREFSSEPYTLIYTAEGVSEDVDAELTQARGALQALGVKSLLQIDQHSGSDVWAGWIRDGDPHPALGEVYPPLVRLGIPPKDLPGFLKAQTVGLKDTAYIADLASGLLFIRSAADVKALRDAALRLGGYAILLNAPPQADFTILPWGYIPESLELMRRLKARWDSRDLFNPGAFLV